MTELSNDPKRKPVRLKTGLDIWGYKTRRELANENIVDGLTGLLNRKGWDQKVSEYQKYAERTGQDLSFLFIDLDDFKTINDKEGHDAGDNHLKEFAEIVKIIARETDIAARYGGDEFIIGLPATSITEANNVKERLLAKSGGIKISIGVGSSVKEADEDMYRMKERNKNV